MCDESDTGIPKLSFSLTKLAFNDFLAEPSSDQAFDALDFMMRILSAKWNQYATSRRCKEGAVHNQQIQDSA